MTDVNMSMVSSHHPLMMYRLPEESNAVNAELTVHRARDRQLELAQLAQKQAGERYSAMHQQAAVAAAAVANVTNGEARDAQQYWYGYPHGHYAHHHHQPTGAQQYRDHVSADVLAWPHHPHFPQHYDYQHHQQAVFQQQQYYRQQQQLPGTIGDQWSSDESNAHIHQPQQTVGTGEPSPPITISGSDVSSPGAPSTPPTMNTPPAILNNSIEISSNNNNNSASTTPVKICQERSPYQWMNKASYQDKPNPVMSHVSHEMPAVWYNNSWRRFNADATANEGQASISPKKKKKGKTRTKDKYRVVYTDHQRLELEKEFIFSRYITIRRKAELAGNLDLSERQVKIWFQNRRAKERKHAKKHEAPKHEANAAMEDGSPPVSAIYKEMTAMFANLNPSADSPPSFAAPPAFGPPPPVPAPPVFAAIGHSPRSQNAHAHPYQRL